MGSLIARCSMVLLATIGSGSVGAAAVDPVVVEWAGGSVEAALAIQPRTIAAFPFRLRNQGAEPRSLTWRVTGPDPWQALGPLSGAAELAAGAELTLPVLLSVPADAAPGPGDVTCIVADATTEKEVARTARAFLVMAGGRLELVAAEDTAIAAGGVPYRVRAWLANHSNVPVEVALTAQSSASWQIELTPGSVALSPGQGAWVQATVRPDRLLDREVAETTRFFATTADLPLERNQAQTRTTTRVLPNSGGRQLLRGWVELEAISAASGDTGVGVNARLAGAVDDHRSLEVRVGQPLPVGTKGALAHRETYLDLQDDRWGGFRAGRTSQSFTRLSAYPQWGDWGEVRLDSGIGQFRLFSSLSDPDTIAGRMAGAGFERGDGDRLRMGALAFWGEHAPTFDSSDYGIVSLWAEGRTESSLWEAELAAGRMGDTHTTESAWRLTGRKEAGRWSFGGEAHATSELFPGTQWNDNLLWGHLGYRPQKSLEVWVSGVRQLSPNLDRAPASDVLTREAGITLSRFTWGSLAVSQSLADFGVTASEPSERTERLTNVRVDVNARADLVATAELGIGDREVGGTTTSITRARYTVQYRRGQRWRLRARMEPAPRNQQVYDFQQRWSLYARWQTSGRTWLEAEGQALRCGQLAGRICESDPTVRMSLGQELRGPMAGWRLIGYAQQGARGDLSSGLRLAHDLAVRSPFSSRGARLSGAIEVGSGVRLPAGVRLYLDDRRIVALPDGGFDFGRVRPGEYALRLEERDLGLSLITDRPLPLPVRVVGGQQEPVVIRLVEAGAVSGRVLIEAGPHLDLESAAAVGESKWEGKEGVAIHLQHQLWPEIKAVVLSGLDGAFSVSRMLPGPWKISVHRADVPAERELASYSEPVIVYVHEGTTEQLASVEIRWRRRSRQLVSGAPITLTTGF